MQFYGYEVSTEGDAFLVAFHEPFDAVAWCLCVQLALHCKYLACRGVSLANTPDLRDWATILQRSRMGDLLGPLAMCCDGAGMALPPI